MHNFTSYSPAFMLHAVNQNAKLRQANANLAVTVRILESQLRDLKHLDLHGCSQRELTLRKKNAKLRRSMTKLYFKYKQLLDALVEKPVLCLACNQHIKDKRSSEWKSINFGNNYGK